VRARALRVFYYRSESAVLLINQSLIYLACYRVVFVHKRRPFEDFSWGGGKEKIEDGDFFDYIFAIRLFWSLVYDDLVARSRSHFRLCENQAAISDSSPIPLPSDFSDCRRGAGSTEGLMTAFRNLCARSAQLCPM